MYVHNEMFDVHRMNAENTRLLLTLELNATTHIFDGNIEVPRETIVKANMTINELLRDIQELRNNIAVHNKTCNK